MTLRQLLVVLMVLILALVLWPVAHSLGPLSVRHELELDCTMP
jgi:hypothetical protein